jgi:hypothetical protein
MSGLQLGAEAETLSSSLSILILASGKLGGLALGPWVLGNVPQVLLHCNQPGRDIGHWGIVD